MVGDNEGNMKAICKSRREPGLWLEEIDAPRPGINDVLIRVRRAGICGTDKLDPVRSLRSLKPLNNAKNQRGALNAPEPN